MTISDDVAHQGGVESGVGLLLLHLVLWDINYFPPSSQVLSHRARRGRRRAWRCPDSPSNSRRWTPSARNPRHTSLARDDIQLERMKIKVEIMTVPMILSMYIIILKHNVLTSLTFSKVTSKAKWMLQTEEKLGYISTTSNFAQFPCGFQKSELYTGFFPEHRCLVSFTSLDARWWKGDRRRRGRTAFLDGDGTLANLCSSSTGHKARITASPACK